MAGRLTAGRQAGAGKPHRAARSLSVSIFVDSLSYFRRQIFQLPGLGTALARLQKLVFCGSTTKLGLLYSFQGCHAREVGVGCCPRFGCENAGEEGGRRESGGRRALDIYGEYPSNEFSARLQKRTATLAARPSPHLKVPHSPQSASTFPVFHHHFRALPNK